MEAFFLSFTTSFDGWQSSEFSVCSKKFSIQFILKTFITRHYSIQVSGQISICPKPELRGFAGGIPLLNHNLRWPTGGKGRYNLPRSLAIQVAPYRSSVENHTPQKQKGNLEKIRNCYEHSNGISPFSIGNASMFHCYVSLPEGNPLRIIIPWQFCWWPFWDGRPWPFNATPHLNVLPPRKKAFIKG